MVHLKSILFLICFLCSRTLAGGKHGFSLKFCFAKPTTLGDECSDENPKIENVNVPRTEDNNNNVTPRIENTQTTIIPRIENTQTSIIPRVEEKKDQQQLELAKVPEISMDINKMAENYYQSYVDLKNVGKRDKESDEKPKVFIEWKEKTTTDTHGENKNAPDLITASAPDLITASAPDLITASAPDLITASAPDLITAGTQDLLTAGTQDLLTDSSTTTNDDLVSLDQTSDLAMAIVPVDPFAASDLASLTVPVDLLKDKLNTDLLDLTNENLISDEITNKAPDLASAKVQIDPLTMYDMGSAIVPIVPFTTDNFNAQIQKSSTNPFEDAYEPNSQVFQAPNYLAQPQGYIDPMTNYGSNMQVNAFQPAVLPSNPYMSDIPSSQIVPFTPEKQQNEKTFDFVMPSDLFLDLNPFNKPELNDNESNNEKKMTQEEELGLDIHE